MKPTFTKVNLNGTPAIQIDGVEPSSIYVTVIRDSQSQLINDEGNHHVVKAHVQEVDINGDEIMGSYGPVTTTLVSGNALADGSRTIEDQLRSIRKSAIKNFISARRVEAAVIPDNLSDIAGDV